MSIWCNYHIDVLAAHKKDVAKFFNIDAENDVTYFADRFSFSCGGKYVPPISYGKLRYQNPDLIFLVKMTNDMGLTNWSISRFDIENNDIQYIDIYSSQEASDTKISKKILENYTKAYPSLPEKHLNEQKGFEEFRWGMFFHDFETTAAILKHAEDYTELIDPYKCFNIKRYLISFQDGEYTEWNGPYIMDKCLKIKEDLSQYPQYTNVKITDVEDIKKSREQ